MDMAVLVIFSSLPWRLICFIAKNDSLYLALGWIGSVLFVHDGWTDGRMDGPPQGI